MSQAVETTIKKPNDFLPDTSNIYEQNGILTTTLYVKHFPVLLKFLTFSIF